MTFGSSELTEEEAMMSSSEEFMKIQQLFPETGIAMVSLHYPSGSDQPAWRDIAAFEVAIRQPQHCGSLRDRAPLPATRLFFVRCTCSKLHPAKRNLDVFCSPHSTNSLVALSTHLGATLRTHARLHRHTALANSKRMSVRAVIPMARASEFAAHGFVDSSHFLGSDDRVESVCRRD